MVGHFLSFFKGNCSLRFEINFVSDQNASDIVLGVLLNFSHPGVHSVERVSVSDVVGHDDSVCALVVAGGDGLEALLASSVPDLKLADFVVRVDCADFEVHSNCWHEILLKLIVCKSQEKARFSDTRIADKQHFEEIVATQKEHS